MDFLTGHGQVGRVQYVVTIVVTALTAAFVLVTTATTKATVGDFKISAMGAIVGVFAVWIILATVVRRIHDIGHSGSMAIFVLIPFIGQVFALYLAFHPAETPLHARAAPRDGWHAPHDLPTPTERDLTNEDGSFNMDGLYTGTGSVRPN